VNIFSLRFNFFSDFDCNALDFLQITFFDVRFAMLDFSPFLSYQKITRPEMTCETSACNATTDEIVMALIIRIQFSVAKIFCKCPSNCEYG